MTTPALHTVTPEELGILRHTLGLQRPKDTKPYRNYFVADDGHSELPILDALVARGLMERSDRKNTLCDAWIYRVTEDGIVVVKASIPSK